MTGGLLPSISATAQTVVTFPDPNLEVLVRQALDIEPGGALLDTDLAQLTELVDGAFGEERIQTLEGIEYAVNITHLGLGNHLMET